MYLSTKYSCPALTHTALSHSSAFIEEQFSVNKPNKFLHSRHKHILVAHIVAPAGI